MSATLGSWKRTGPPGATAHALMVYRDGTFALVMLGVSTPEAIGSYLSKAAEVGRTRNAALG
ncbi:hypothetical protein AB3X91_41825 [Paraburkholderia sp. BR14263]|uniref:hypothetical protein n=1 Tax=unclassified Paraburkholderia TaxID=2615204 RepID=UPI0034CFFD6C